MPFRKFAEQIVMARDNRGLEERGLAPERHDSDKNMPIINANEALHTTAFESVDINSENQA